MQENGYAIHHEEAIASTSQQIPLPRNLSSELQEVVQTLTRDTIQKICDEQSLVYCAFTQNEGHLLETSFLLEHIILLSTDNTGKTSYFLRESVLGTSDSGFGALGVTREHFCRVMQQHAADKTIREAVKDSIFAMLYADRTIQFSRIEQKKLDRLKLRFNLAQNKLNNFLQKYSEPVNPHNHHQVVIGDGIALKIKNADDTQLIVDMHATYNKDYQKKLRALQEFCTRGNIYQRYFQAMARSKRMELDTASLIAYAQREMPKVNLQIWESLPERAQIKKTAFQSQPLLQGNTKHILLEKQHCATLIPLSVELTGSPISASSHEHSSPEKFENMYLVQKAIAKKCKLEALAQIHERFKGDPQYENAMVEFSSAFAEYFTIIDQKMVCIGNDDLFIRKRAMIQTYLDKIIPTSRINKYKEKVEGQLASLKSLREKLLSQEHVYAQAPEPSSSTGETVSAQDATSHNDKPTSSVAGTIPNINHVLYCEVLKEQIHQIAQCWLAMATAMDFIPVYKIYLNDLLDLICQKTGCNPLHLSIFYSKGLIKGYCFKHRKDEVISWFQSVGNTPFGLLTPLELAYTKQSLEPEPTGLLAETLKSAVDAFTQEDRNYYDENYPLLLTLLESCFKNEKWNLLHLYAQYPLELNSIFIWCQPKLRKQNHALGRVLIRGKDSQNRTPIDLSPPGSDQQKKLEGIFDAVVNAKATKQAFHAKIKALLENNLATGQSGDPQSHVSELVDRLKSYFEKNHVINLKRRLGANISSIERAYQETRMLSILTHEQRMYLVSLCEAARELLQKLCPFDELENQQIRALEELGPVKHEDIHASLTRQINEYLQRLVDIQQKMQPLSVERIIPDQRIKALLSVLSKVLTKFSEVYSEYSNALDGMMTELQPNDPFPIRWIRAGMDHLHGSHYLSKKGMENFSPYVLFTKQPEAACNKRAEGASHPMTEAEGVYFKFSNVPVAEDNAPLKPTKDFMAHSLHPKGNTPPHRVIKFSYYGFRENAARVAQASLTVPGLDFQDVLEHDPSLVNAIDLENLAYKVEHGIRTTNNDLKPNNLKLHLRRLDRSTSLEQALLFKPTERFGHPVFARLAGFDNELSFSPVLRRTNNTIYMEVCNVIYCIEPWMEAEVPSKHREKYLQEPSQQIMLNWFHSLISQNKAYQRLKEDAEFNDDDFKRLGLPIRIPVELIPCMVAREELIRNAYLNARGEELTFNDFLKQVEPLLGDYYEALRQEFKEEGEEGYLMAIMAVHGECRGENAQSAGRLYDLESLLVDRNPSLESEEAKSAARKELRQRIKDYENQVKYFEAQGQWLYLQSQEKAGDYSLEQAIEAYISNVDLGKLPEHEVEAFIKDIQKFEGIQHVVLRGLPWTYQKFERHFFRSGHSTLIDGLKQLTFLSCTKISENDLISLRKRCSQKLKLRLVHSLLDLAPQQSVSNALTLYRPPEVTAMIQKNPVALVAGPKKEIVDPTEALIEALKESPKYRYRYIPFIWFLLRPRETDEHLQAHLLHERQKELCEVSIKIIQNLQKVLQLYQNNHLLSLNNHPDNLDLLYQASAQQQREVTPDYYLRCASQEGLPGLLRGLEISHEEFNECITGLKEALLEKMGSILPIIVGTLLTSPQARRRLLHPAGAWQAYQSYIQALTHFTTLAQKQDIPTSFREDWELSINWLKTNKGEEPEVIEEMTQKGIELAAAYQTLLESFLAHKIGERYLNLLQRGVLPIERAAAVLFAKEMQCAVRFWYIVDGMLHLEDETSVQDPRRPLDVLCFIKKREGREESIPCYDRLERVEFSQDSAMPSCSSSTNMGYDYLPLLNLMLRELVYRGRLLGEKAFANTVNRDIDVPAFNNMFEARWQQADTQPGIVLNLPGQAPLNCYVVDEQAGIPFLITELEKRSPIMLLERGRLSERPVIAYTDQEREERRAQERAHLDKRNNLIERILKQEKGGLLYIPYRCRAGMTRERLLTWEGAADQYALDASGRNLVGILAYHTPGPLRADSLYQFLTIVCSIPDDLHDNMGISPRMMNNSQALVQLGGQQMIGLRQSTFIVPQLRFHVIEYLEELEMLELAKNADNSLTKLKAHMLEVFTWYEDGHADVKTAEDVIAVVDVAMLNLSLPAFFRRIEELLQNLEAKGYGYRNSWLAAILRAFINEVRSKRDIYQYLFNECSLVIPANSTNSSELEQIHTNTARGMVTGAFYRELEESRQLVVVMRAELDTKNQELGTVQAKLDMKNQELGTVQAKLDTTSQELGAVRAELVVAEQRAENAVRNEAVVKGQLVVEQNRANDAAQRADNAENAVTHLQEELAKVQQEREKAQKLLQVLYENLKKQKPEQARPGSSTDEEMPNCGFFWGKRH